MISEPDIIIRTTAVIDRAIKRWPALIGFREMIIPMIEQEFAMPDDWQPVAHKPDWWSLKNIKTGEVYKGNAARGGKRLIVFKSLEAARRKAYLKNKDLI